jgi:hypothetical protein
MVARLSLCAQRVDCRKWEVLVTTSGGCGTALAATGVGLGRRECDSRNRIWPRASTH